jgi:uncharacterized protein (TIGR00730 family)
MNKVICVFSSSSNTIDPKYFEAAAELGNEIAGRGDVFLFGGGLTGLMGACAHAVHQRGGRIIGVIPEALNEKGIVFENCDELVVTDNMRERKAEMDARSDAFIALPGGFGTIEEIMEIITLKQLRYHNKPIVILNVSGYYNPLLAQFQSIVGQQFAKPGSCDLFLITDSVTDALDYIEHYIPAGYEERWLTDVLEPVSTEGRSAAAVSDAAGTVLKTADFEYCKLEVFIPKTHLALLQDTLRSVDAGHIGNYDSCLSYGEATGCWRALPGSSPYEGEYNTICEADEYKVEAICLKSRVEETIRAVKEIHPYEVPVINAIPLYKTGY